MKLLLMTIDFAPQTGGVARYLQLLASYFGEEMHVIAEPREGSENVDSGVGYTIERIPLLSKSMRPRWILALKVLLVRAKLYDTVVVSHVLPIGTVAWATKLLTRTPYIVIVHGLDVALTKRSPFKRFLATRILRGAKNVVANSYSLAAEVDRDFGVKRIVVAYPPVDPQFLKSIDAQKAQNGSVVNLLTVSRLVERKGHDRVLEALVELRKRGQLDEVHYHIVGSGPLLESIQEKVDEFDLKESVTIHTNVSDEALKDLYKTSDVFVMPTKVINEEDREGFGMVYLEAAAYGIPAIASNHPGPDEAVLHGKTGLVVPDGNIHVLAGAIHELACNTQKRIKLGEAAAKRAEKEFAPEYQFSKLRAIL